MSRPEHICVFHSRGPHFIRTLKRLRQAHPDAVITALTPPKYPAADEVAQYANELRTIELAHYSPADPAACWRLVQKIRAAHFTMFVVLFDSLQLRVLSAMTGIPKRACYALDGRVFPVRASIATSVIGAVSRNIFGRAVYAVLWVVVYGFRARQTSVSSHEHDKKI